MGGGGPNFEPSKQPVCKAPDGFITLKVHKSFFKVSNFKKRLFSLWDRGVGGIFAIGYLTHKTLIAF